MSYAAPEQIVTANRIVFDTAVEIAHAQFAAVQRVLALNLETTRATLQSAGDKAKTAFDAKSLTSLQPEALLQPDTSGLVDYTGKLYAIASETQHELTKLAETRVGELRKNFDGLLEKAIASAPAGSDVAVAAVKSAWSAASSVFDGLTSATKQAVELAEKGTANAVEAVGSSARAAARKAGKAA